MTPIEERLRAVLRADARSIAVSAPPPADPGAQGGRFQRPTAAMAVVAVAAATVAVLVALRLLAGFAVPRSAPAAPHASASTAVTAMTVTATTITTTVKPSGAAASIPEVAVHGPDSHAAARATGTLQQHVTDQIAIFQNRVKHSRSASPGTTSLHIVLSDTVAWKQYLSVRFSITTQLGGDKPIIESSALVFDVGGGRIDPVNLFTDRGQLTTVVRDALIGSRLDGSLQGTGLATLSLAPTSPGHASPVTCYPTNAGLDCFVNPGSLTPEDLGAIEVTVPWTQLATLLRPGSS